MSDDASEIDEHGPGRPGQYLHQVVPSDPAYDGAAGGSPVRHTGAPAQPEKEKVAAIVLSAILGKADGETYGASHARKMNEDRAEKAAERILALAAQPPAAPVEPFDVLSTIEPDADLPTAQDVRGILPRSSADSRRDEIAAGAFYKTRGDKNNLPHIVGPLEHDLNDGDAPWKARVYDQVWKWGYDGLANADGSPHNRDLVERVYRPAPMLDEPQTVVPPREEIQQAITNLVNDGKIGFLSVRHAYTVADDILALSRPQHSSEKEI
jgi:hypothetical protein